MKKKIQICPNCVEELKPQQKLLGKFINWMICGICGYRERPHTKMTEAYLGNLTHDRLQFRNYKQVTSKGKIN